MSRNRDQIHICAYKKTRMIVNKGIELRKNRETTNNKVCLYIHLSLLLDLVFAVLTIHEPDDRGTSNFVSFVNEPNVNLGYSFKIQHNAFNELQNYV